MQSATETSGAVSNDASPPEPVTEFPVREYIGAMALELAQMARWDGDEALARLLESASNLAIEPLKRGDDALSADPRAS